MAVEIVLGLVGFAFIFAFIAVNELLWYTKLFFMSLSFLLGIIAAITIGQYATYDAIGNIPIIVNDVVGPFFIWIYVIFIMLIVSERLWTSIVKWMIDSRLIRKPKEKDG
jgi:hypothetical protein